MSWSDSSVVVDTNVISMFIRGDELADFYRAQISGLQLLISFQTSEELWYGAYKGRWGERRQGVLNHHLQQYEIIWPDSDLVEVCARLRHERRSVGRVMGQADAWIAATALLLDCPLASSDQDFRGIPELELIQAA